MKDLCEADLTPLETPLKNWKAEALMAGLDVLISTKRKFRETGQTTVLLELAVIRLCRLAEMLPLADVARRLDGFAKGATRGTPMASSARITAPPTKALPAPSTSCQTVEPPASPSQLYSLEQPDELWKALLETLGDASPMRMQLTRAVRYTYQPPGALLVSFAPGSEASREYCTDSNRCARLEDMLKKLTGKNVAIRFDIAQDVTVAATLPKALQQKQQVMQVPLAKAVMEQLGGQLVHMDEGFGAE